MPMLNEQLLSLSEAAKHLPKINGKRVHRSAIYRWCTIGINGISLESVQVAGRVCTSREALERFTRRLEEARGTPMADYRTEPKPTKGKKAEKPRPKLKGKRRTPAQRRAAKAQSRETLRRLGV